MDLVHGVGFRVWSLYDEIKSCRPVNFTDFQDPTVSRELSLPVAAEISFDWQRAAPSPTKALSTALLLESRSRKF